MAKQYKGSLSLEWFNKQKSIVTLDDNNIKSENDIPAPRINWINKEEALFYELNQEEGKGNTPYWVNRYDIRVKEARPLVFQKAFRAVEKDKKGTLPGTDKEFVVEEITKEADALDIDNILIKGDNLLALNTLKKHFDNLPNNEKIKCIYIDPPYNTGAAFDHYDDNMEHSEWLTMFRDRVVALKNLLQDNGFIFVQLDDAEGPYGKIVLDEIFGSENFVVTMYVQVRYDEKTLKEDMVFNKLIEQIYIYKNGGTTREEVNREQVEYTDEKFCYYVNELKEPDETLELGGKKVEVFNSESYKIEKLEPSRKGLKEIWASGSILDGNSSGRFFRDYLTGRQEIDGLGVLYKVANIGDDERSYRYFTGPKKETATRGKYYQGVPKGRLEETTSFKYVPISNFIDLAAYFGNCRHEGGVEFKSGKKPEVLISKLLELATSPGDIVLDCFGGSGSTFGVAQKMGRKWIGIELGEQADTHIIPRLLFGLSGKDKTGISKEYDFKGGGSFKYYHLGESIINVDKETGKGEFNWTLGKQFIQESLLVSYDFVVQKDIDVFPAQIFKDNKAPTVGKLLGKNNKSIYGLSFLVAPGEKDLTISNQEIKSIYSVLKKQPDFHSLVIYTNKGIDIAQDAMPDDMDIIKVPHAIFAELER